MRVAFLSLLCLLTKPYHFGVNWPSRFAKTKMGCISLPSNSNGILGITSYYCVILKMVLLHDARKQFRMGFPCCCFLRIKTCFKKKTKNVYKKTKITGRLGFSKKRVFLNPDYLSIVFCDFPLIARSGTSHATISLIGCAPHTQSIGPWYWRSWGLLTLEYVKLMLTIKQVPNN